MSGIERLFNATLSIERKSLGAADDYNEHAESWAVVAADVPCRIQGMRGRENTENKQAVLVTHLAVMLAGTDLTEKDRVLSDGVSYEVLYANKAPGGVTGSHVEAELRELRV